MSGYTDTTSAPQRGPPLLHATFKGHTEGSDAAGGRALSFDEKNI